MPTREQCQNEGIHTLDNQGLCHWCGELLEPDFWDHYVNGPSKNLTHVKSLFEAREFFYDGEFYMTQGECLCEAPNGALQSISCYPDAVTFYEENKL
jgi:hypothetical protein